MAQITNDFNKGAGQKIERKFLATFVDVGSTDTPEFELIGAGVEDSSIETNPDSTSVTDILGFTETTINKLERKQTLEPFTLKAGSKLAYKLHKQIRENKLSELAMYKVMTVYMYLDGAEEGSYQADLETGCTIMVNSLGGSATVDMPIEISYSNNKTYGTAKKDENNKWQFTQATQGA